MDEQEVLDILLGNHYYTIDDLRYNNRIGLLFSKDKLEEYTKKKEAIVETGHYAINRLPLKTFNSKYCYYVMGDYLKYAIGEYSSTLHQDKDEHGSDLFERNMMELMQSRVFSEVENSLDIENVPSTRKRIQEIYNDKKPLNRNDVIIKNMLDAIEFILTDNPTFSKENLYKLYNILSHDCLDEDNMLKDGNYYRDNAVYVGGFEGANHNEIDDMMNSLFDFVNNKKHDTMELLMLPHICHYYIVYIHPYFDYNGRTARMVSLWISRLFNITYSPFFISEAINERKNEYYKALVNARTAGNDITYFLGYIVETATRFSLIYKNVEEINTQLSQSGNFLTPSERMYLKKILIHSPQNYFNVKMFTEFAGNELSRVGAMKVLNSLTAYNVLYREFNKKNETIFRVNTKYLKYAVE